MNQKLNPNALLLQQQLSDARGWEQRFRELLLLGKVYLQLILLVYKD